MHETSLVELGQRYADARGVTLWRVGYLAAGDGKFFVRLQAGRTCTLRLARTVVQYLSDHWPDDHDWPDEIPRPPVPAPRAPHTRRPRLLSEQAARSLRPDW